MQLVSKQTEQNLSFLLYSSIIYIYALIMHINNICINDKWWGRDALRQSTTDSFGFCEEKKQLS